jgi:hypothetical protein
MEARRQLIRYAIAGGYAVMIGAFYEGVFGWAWKESVDEVVLMSRADAFTTIGGAVAVGFVLYQIYSAFDRPPVRFAFTPKLPRWAPARIRAAVGEFTLRLQLFGAGDVSGKVLGALEGLPAAERALQRAFSRGETEPSTGPRDGVRSWTERAHRLDEANNLLSSVLNLTYSSGDGQIARSYAAIEDIYHALGACQTALVAISLATAIDIVAKHSDAFAAHLGPSLAVTALSLALIWGSNRVIRVNRRRLWLAMTNQLRNDLRAWALRHPQLLSELAKDGGSCEQ